MPESTKKFLIDFIISTIPKLVSKSKGLVFIPIITKTLGQDAYGIWTNFTIGITFIAGFASLSLGAATNKFLADASQERLTSEYWAIIIVTMVSAAMTGLLLLLFRNPVASVIFGSSTRSHLVLVLTGALVFTLYSRQSVQFYRSQRRMGIFASVQSIRSLGEIGTVVVAALIFESITAILVSFVVFNLLLSIGLGVSIVKDYGIRYPDFSRIGQYVRFGVPLVVSGTMYWFVNVSDRYLLTYFHSVDVTGGYAVVYATASGLSILSMAIGTVLFPDLSALRANNDFKEYRRRLSNVLKYYFIITIPAAVGLIVIADPLLLLLSTPSIYEYTDLMFVLAPAMVAYGLVNILIQALLSDGRSRVSAGIWGAIAVLNLGANVVLVPQYSAMGASVTTLGSFVVGLVIVVQWKRDDIMLSLVLLGKVLVASVIMGAIVVFVQSLIPTSNIVALPVLIGIGILVYGVLGFTSGFLTKLDVEYILDAI